MSEDRQVPATITTALPVMPTGGKPEIAKASEKIEMQRATAETLAAFQIARLNQRNERECYDRIIELCKNVHFASEALYAVPRGGGSVTGLTVGAAKEFARIWGNIQMGTKEHGAYNGETQLQAFAIDLENNSRWDTLFTVRHERWADQKVHPVRDPQSVSELCKARGSKEVRNCILSVLPPYIKEEAEKQCKRTLHQEARDVREAWFNCVKSYEKLGIAAQSLLRYVNKKDPEKLDAGDIVDLRVLFATIKESPDVAGEVFPERKKVTKEAEGEKRQAPENKTTEPINVLSPVAAVAHSTSEESRVDIPEPSVATELPGKKQRRVKEPIEQRSELDVVEIQGSETASAAEAVPSPRSPGVATKIDLW